MTRFLYNVCRPHSMYGKFIVIFSLLLLSTITVAITAEETEPEFTGSPSFTIVAGAPMDYMEILLTGFNETQAARDLGICYGCDDNFVSIIYPSTIRAFKYALSNPDIGSDIAFDIPSQSLNSLLNQSLIKAPTNSELIDQINNEIPDSFGDVSLKSNNLTWVASHLNPFGMVVNPQTLSERNLEVPTNLTDLSSKSYFTTSTERNLALGNALDTTSYSFLYGSIINEFGWVTGWNIITSMAANGDIYGGALETLISVIRGDTAVTPTRDYYGLFAMKENTDVEFIIPQDFGLIDRKTIALSSLAENNDLTNAEAFMQYVLSEQGQAHLLNNTYLGLPVRENIFDFVKTNYLNNNSITGYDYVSEMETIYNASNTVPVSLAYFSTMDAYYDTLRHYFQAGITEVHSELRSTWSDLVENEYITDAMFDEFAYNISKTPLTMEEAISINDQLISDSNFQMEKNIEWNTFAVNKYKEISVKISGIDEPLTTESSSTSATVSDSTQNTLPDTPTSEVNLSFSISFQIMIVFIFSVYKRRIYR